MFNFLNPYRTGIAAYDRCHPPTRQTGWEAADLRNERVQGRTERVEGDEGVSCFTLFEFFPNFGNLKRNCRLTEREAQASGEQPKALDPLNQERADTGTQMRSPQIFILLSALKLLIPLRMP